MRIKAEIENALFLVISWTDEKKLNYKCTDSTESILILFATLNIFLNRKCYCELYG